MEELPQLIVALVALGMGASFFASDRDSPTSRALSLMLALSGLTFAVGPTFSLGLLSQFAAYRLSSLFTAGAIVAGVEWLLRIGRDEPRGDPRARGGERLLRASQALAVGYGAAGLALPGLRAEVFDPGWDPHLLARPGFYFFAALFYGSLAVAVAAVVLFVGRRVDSLERVRLVAFGVATPFLVSGIIVPAPWEALTTVVGELIFLGGAVRYHLLQGQRGQFLARFLSPEVAREVRERGLSSTMQQKRVQISVVACDLRGFTAFAETAAPEEVMALLGEYYDAVGRAVTACGGTIKDFAGDGILVLVGAPIPYPDHAERALALAIGIRERGREALSRWARLGLELGLGVGVASGFVTVGTIGGAGRLEYAAIGPAVNLAARLCDRADAWQVLADQRTVGLLGAAEARFRIDSLEPAELKGFARPVPVVAVSPAAAAAT